MTMTLIAAVAENDIIGADGDLAWRNSEDLRRFKKLTLGHPVVLGRRTFDSIGRALPGRRTIVVTRSVSWSAEGVEVAHSIEDALALVAGQDVFILGGGEIYAQTIALADRLEITRVERDLMGDTTFPAISASDFEQTHHDQRDGFSFVTYCRRSTAPRASRRTASSASIAAASGSTESSKAASGEWFDGATS